MCESTIMYRRVSTALAEEADKLQELRVRDSQTNETISTLFNSETSTDDTEDDVGARKKRGRKKKKLLSVIVKQKDNDSTGADPEPSASDTKSESGSHQNVLPRSYSAPEAPHLTATISTHSIDGVYTKLRRESQLPEPKRDPTKKITSHSRNAKYHRIFKHVPEDEHCINYYSCAYVGDILLQGMLYVSKNYFCFYSNIIGYKTKIVIPVDKVVSISKERTALFIPNALHISTEDKKYAFTSLLNRDKTYNLLTRVWEKLSKTDSQGCLSNGSTESSLSQSLNDDDDDTTLQDSGNTTRKSSVYPYVSFTENLPSIQKGHLPRGLLITVIGLMLVLILSALYMSIRVWVLTQRMSDAYINPTTSFLAEMYKMRNIIHQKSTNQMQHILNENLMTLQQVKHALASVFLVAEESY